MKKIILTILLLLILLAGGYYYMTHFYGVKNYATATADFTVTGDQLKNEFSANEATATKKYQNKTVVVSGTVNDVSADKIGLSGVACKITKPEAEVKAGDKVSIKGRLVGYDSLLEEVQMDECSVTK